VRTDETQNDAVVTTQNTLYGLITVLRPHQWAKNLLIFVGLIFSRSLSDWHNISVSLAAFVLFCAASSGIYIFNDLCDLEADKSHPSKRLRPLPAGTLNLNLARLVMTLLFAAATIGALYLHFGFALLISLYLLLNLFYSLGLKRAVILDVMLISAGFVLRAIAGAVVLNVEVSNWLVLCTSMLALLIGFGKRRHELNLLGENANLHRQSLADYSFQFLDLMMTICGGAAVVTYALYTMADETVARFKTRNLLLTLPFVVYGIFRYLFLVHRKKEGGEPVQMLFQDVPTIINILLWVLVVCAVIYGPVVWKLF
jgi:4-hydroxybenzoate polyprenyltransferase